uniref:Nuclease associated modular domain-containing protein n=1 Tax=Arthrobotrys musiformis TaxID=47236 RepID=A0A482EAW4_9PEZI|nr:hypothetical protein [Arthrobotrys musiformis]QBM31467.1 hypothetical protein [Arthrobotrys musiformis]QBM31620.1 hypothetical protein [Arthrobotrys musiformis]
MYGKNHTEEARAKIAAGNKGKIRTSEAITKFIAAKVGNKNPMYGKPRAAGAGRSFQKIDVIDVKNNRTTRYNSISAAALALDIKQSRISTYFYQNQKKPYQGKYIFKKV